MEYGFHVEAQGDAIHVAQPGTSLAMTFHGNNGSGMLEAWDFLSSPSPSREELQFAATAWKLAYAEAKALGWLRAMPVHFV